MLLNSIGCLLGGSCKVCLAFEYEKSNTWSLGQVKSPCSFTPCNFGRYLPCRPIQESQKMGPFLTALFISLKFLDNLLRTSLKTHHMMLVEHVWRKFWFGVLKARNEGGRTLCKRQSAGELCPEKKPLQIARGQWQSPCAVPRRSGLTSPETYHEEMASDKSSRAKVRETFSVKTKDLTLHTSVDFGWFYGQVIRVLMWLPIIQSLSQEQQAWEFNSGQFQGSQCTNDEGTFLAHCGHWRYKKVTAYICVYLGYTGTTIYQPFAQALSHLIHPLQCPPQIQDGWLGNPPWM